ncbi:hypothetical protein [Paenibacillus sp. NAIST15-1]|uniref:hypothetical protein n=1 Tax=Paenibacillus sp. NAIST15-1 TaxID=1605994 RepID=UPI00086A9987|nr:hypothetical protein [Paenibacillus sp. NAIST15-1]GAV11500.1 hypothetical protein PBN151_1429 [Paenibacillus sp. NAIST15-1]
MKQELVKGIEEVIKSYNKKQNTNQYQFEKKKLYAHLGLSLVQLLTKYECYIAGGTITSLMCNREINDIDIYFRDEKSLIGFVEEVWGDGWVISQTDKALLIKYQKTIDTQLIYFKYFSNPEEIFETFDFTVCMGCFDFKTEEFILHEDFFKHNSQRLLKFNPKTAYPIISLMRTWKYKEKQYKISKAEMIRIILTCMQLNITSLTELKEQLGGMYGNNFDKLLKDEEGNEKELDMNEVIEYISELSMEDKYFETPSNLKREFGNMQDFLDDLIKSEVEYIVINKNSEDEEIYRIYNGKLHHSESKPKIGKELDPVEYFKNKKYYKFVKKNKEGKYFSFYDSNFEYIIGVIAIAKENGYYHTPALYFNELRDINKSTYSSEQEKALLEVTVDSEELVDVDGDTIKFKKCHVVREVPKEEYASLLGKEDDDWI